MLNPLYRCTHHGRTGQTLGRGRKEQPVSPAGYLFLYQAAFKLDFEGSGSRGAGIRWMVMRDRE